jgi:hypothetical protein
MTRTLRAGPFTALYDPATGFIRRIRFGECEVLRGIYAAIRDRNWRTIPPQIREVRCDISPRAFTIEFAAEHRLDDIAFSWRGLISGFPDGSIHYSFDGKAQSSFSKSRIGFCVLHPIRECAGRAAVAETCDGQTRDVRFPDLVAEQQPLPGFTDLASLKHEVQPDLWARVVFIGERFETEDQRNWTDASFKTYCTPLSLPFPVELEAGTQVRQEIRLQLLATRTPAIIDTPVTAGQTSTIGAASCAIQIDPCQVFERLPELGTALPLTSPALSPAEMDRLAHLQLTHFRIELYSDTQGPVDALQRAAREAGELGLSLELVLHCPAGGMDFLERIRSELTRLRVDLTRVLVLTRDHPSTTRETFAAARTVLGDLGVPLGAGTAADLYELHLQPPPADADFIAWSMNPQVHAFDDLSILETPPAVSDQLRTMRARYPGAGLVVSPVTLKPRFNPVAIGPEPPLSPGGLPHDADPRQASMLAAAWTVAMLAVLLPGGIDDVTFFKAVGLTGLMLSGDRQFIPASFLAEPGMVYPVYHVLRAMAGARYCAALPLTSDEGCAALRLQADRHMDRLIAANLSAEPRLLRLSLDRTFRSVRILHAGNSEAAMRDPESFWRPSPVSSPTELSLPELGIAIVDFTTPAGSHP